jgi:hypothetical protein
MTFKSRVIRGIGASALIATMLASSTTALAQTTSTATTRQSDNASTAVPISGNGAHYTGSIAPAPSGGWAGTANRFAYYKFKLDGSKRTVTISAQVYPDDPTALNNVGFVVYGPQSVTNPSYIYASSGASPKKSPNISGDLDSTDAGDYLIQVYNDSRVPISFDLWVTGLPPQPAQAAQTSAPVATAAPAAPVATQAPAPVATATPAPSTSADVPSTASPTAQSGNNFSGDLAPGKFDVFQFDYPGDGRVYTVNVEITPDNRDVLANAGFEVYRPNGTLQVKGGSQQKLVPNVSANVISQTAGTYTIKVYNNVAGVTVHYTVTLVTGKKENEK